MDTWFVVGKVRKYALLCFLIPLITINLCLIFYSIMGKIEPYANLQWDQKLIKLSNKKFLKSHENMSFLNCPKYEFTTSYFVEENNQYNIEAPSNERLIASTLIQIVSNPKLNNNCVKNYKLTYLLLNNFKILDKILLSAKKHNKIGFASNVKMPYFYGEVSISRTARYFPATLIFKPFMVLSALFLFLYWKNNFKLFENLKSKNIIGKFSKTFFYFGLFSSAFLALHALFLGLEYDSKLFSKIRSANIILFVFSEILAQVFLTLNLFKLKKNLESYLNNLILKTKFIFVSIVSIATCLVFAMLIFENLETSTKNIIEWNYFSILLIYYILSYLIWKKVRL